MEVREILRKSCFAFDLRSPTKRGIIEEMVGMLAEAGRVADRQSALKAVLEREAKGSTGLGCGVAMPHGRLDGVDGLATAIGLRLEGVDFESADRRPARIFVMTLFSPLNATRYMQYMAAVSRQLNCTTARELLLSATTVGEIVEILAGG